MQATNWAPGHWYQQLGSGGSQAKSLPPKFAPSLPPAKAKAAQYQKLPPNIKSSSIIGAITITTATIKYIQC